MIRISHRHVNQKVIPAGDVEDAPHLGKLDHISPEVFHEIPRMAPQPDRDHRLETDPEGSRIDFGMVTAQHSETKQSPNPFETGGGCDSHRLRKSIVRHPSILLQNRENGEVDSVEILEALHKSNYIRFLARSKNLLLKSKSSKNYCRFRDRFSESEFENQITNKTGGPMKFDLLSTRDIAAIDALKQHYGGATAISEAIRDRRDLATRLQLLENQGYGEMMADATRLVDRFAKIEEFEGSLESSYRSDFGIATSQVSGFQGAKVTHRSMVQMAESAGTDDPCWVPSEFISVVALTENYVYSGDLMATLTMAENIMGASKFCSTNLIGTPLPSHRFATLESITGKTFETMDLGNGMSQIILKNMGTAFGNLGGVEVANDNHLVYLDGVIRAAMETGNDFFLNPSWSSIIAACYFARDIPNLRFKVSMLLSTQNLMQFRMLLNIMSTYLRDDQASPIYEINIGNGVSPENFILCSEELDRSGIRGLSLAAHLRINPDLGLPDFDWTDNAFKVLENGTNLTFKYESDGTARDFDTMEAYFMPEEERAKVADTIGDVIYYKSLRASMDGREMMRRGIRTRFGAASYRANAPADPTHGDMEAAAV